MDEKDVLQLDELIEKNNVLSEVFSINRENERLFAVELCDGATILELEYQSVHDIKAMIACNKFIFIKAITI